MKATVDPPLDFPSDFVWGVATSAYQIEGAADADGKGQSIWDTFCRRPGVIADGSNGEVACDHYHRWPADLDIAASLGVDAYRFSVAWPRVQPQGRGPWNEAGLSLYDRLVDGVLERGMQPFITLNHWDLPQALQDGGGWENRDTVHRFVDYALGMVRRLGDRVASITTHNEPWVVAMLGHESGIFAPGVKSRASAMQVSHHLLLSHGLALRAMRAEGCRKPMGIVLNLSPVTPRTDSAEDRAAARLADGLLLRWYLDPLVKGEYPADVLEHLGADAPLIEPDDLAAMTAPNDFLGINYYTRSIVGTEGGVDAATLGVELTDMGWGVFPDGLTELLVRLHRDYPMPAFYVTENGGAFPDELKDGRVADERRTHYLATHIAAVGEALAQGVPMAGYMVWSLLDNFEWASGYAKRFGIVHVDYATQRRTLKDSALWYRGFLQRVRAAQGAGAMLAKEA